MKSKIKIFILLLFSISGFCQQRTPIQKELIKKFPQVESFSDDIVWTYDPRIIPEKLKLPLLQSYFIGYDVYKVQLFLHIARDSDQPYCIVFYNENTNDLIFIEPFAYKNLNQPFYKRLLGFTVKDSNDLKNFADEFLQIFFLDSGIEIPKTVTLDKNLVSILSTLETNGILFRKIEIILESSVVKEIRQLDPRSSQVESIIN